MSARFSPAARTSARTRSAAGLGASTASRISRPSTPPKEVMVTARIFLVGWAGNILLLAALSPVAWTPTGMSNSENHQLIMCHPIHECVWKAVNEISSEVFVDSWPSVRTLPNLFKPFENFFEQLVAKTTFAFLVVGDGRL